MHISLLVSVLGFFASSAAPLPAPVCQTQSLPNPIKDEYPGDAGTINGTTAIVPIPYSVARSIVPSQYGILTAAYEKLIPGFPHDMFPAEFEGVLDHDVGSSQGSIPDFHRIALRFPFVDRLNDGYSCFRYTAPQIISLNLVALVGSAYYGKTDPGTFSPPCDGYAGNKSATYLTAYNLADASLGFFKPAFDTRFETVDKIEYSQKLFVNITNQPSFGSGAPICDNYITLYNSSVTQGQSAPVPVKGTIKVVPPYYPVEATLKAWGFRMDNAFVERNNIPCDKLKGYAGTGPGDSG